jgi:hypothetical protein
VKLDINILIILTGSFQILIHLSKDIFLRLLKKMERYFMLSIMVGLEDVTQNKILLFQDNIII